MIKNKKYNNTKGGRITNFDFDKITNKNKNDVSKKYIFFELKLSDHIIQKFKISQHTFAHFDEFSNVDLKGKITKFTNIMQFFVVFIFLLNSMTLQSDDFKNPTNCNTPKLKDSTCQIKKYCNYNNHPLNLTIYIEKIKTQGIFITSLFEKNGGPKIELNNIINIELMNNKNNKHINFTEITITKLLNDQTNIMNNNYNINYILQLLKDDYDDGSMSSVLPSPIKATNVKIYKFSIPKLSGGKKHKMKSSKKRQNKGRWRKTRKK
jgi:hypothetical protein